MVMRTLCARFVWTTIRARLSLLGKNIGTSAGFSTYITEKSHTKKCVVFSWQGVYASYATCIWQCHI